MHTPHARDSTRYDAPARPALYTGRETEPRGIRAYSAEPRTHPDKPYPRFREGNFWLEVFTEMVKTMDLPVISGYLTLGRIDAGWLSMAHLRRELLAPTTPAEARDQAWRHVLHLVRNSDFVWHYFAIGLAMPGLWNRALSIAPRKHRLPPPFIARVHRHLTTEFVLAMHNVDMDEPNVVARMLDQATYATRGHPNRKPPPHTFVPVEHETVQARIEDAVQQVQPDPIHHLGTSKADRGRFSRGEAYLALHRLWKRTNHPQWHSRDKITREDAQLIAYTYLEGHTLGEVAPWFGLSESGAQARREAVKKVIARLLSHHTDQKQP